MTAHHPIPPTPMPFSPPITPHNKAVLNNNNEALLSWVYSLPLMRNADLVNASGR